MKRHHPNCPACAAEAQLNITDSVQSDLLHAVAVSLIEQDQIISKAKLVGFDLSDDVIDTLAECIDAACQATAPKSAMDLN